MRIVHGLTHPRRGDGASIREQTFPSGQWNLGSPLQSTISSLSQRSKSHREIPVNWKLACLISGKHCGLSGRKLNQGLRSDSRALPASFELAGVFASVLLHGTKNP